MQKIVIHSAGGYERLQLETHPDPEPGPEEVLVEVQAIGVNYADVCVRLGVYESAKQYVGWPITPGFEFAGVVTGLGSAASGFARGDRVFGVTRFGAYASHVLAAPWQLRHLPTRFSPEQAAGFPAVYFTAYHALFQSFRLRPGATVLIHSAAGGVGSAAVQLGKKAGCRVIGVVGASHKVDHVRALGCDVVIDKSTEELWPAVERAAPEGCDAILDANGPETLKQSYEHVRPTGKLVTYGFHSMIPRKGGRLDYVKAALGLLRMPRFRPFDLVKENRSVIGFNLSFLFERRDLFEEAFGDLLAWIDDGTLAPPAVTTFPLADVARAHQLLESGQTTGKLILTP